MNDQLFFCTISEREWNNGEIVDCQLPTATFPVRSGDRVGVTAFGDVIPYQAGMTIFGQALQDAQVGQSVKVRAPINGASSIYAYSETRRGWA